MATWADFLLPGLEKRGWQAILGLVSGPRYHRPAQYLEAHPYHRVVSIHCNSGTRYGRVKAVRAALRNVRPDVLLTANIPDAIIATAAERNSGNSRSRIVMSCHGIQRDLFEDMRCLRNELDHVVCTNKLACRLAESVGGIEPERVHHAPCGTVVPDELPARVVNNQFTIAFAGRLEQDQKRVFDLVEIGAALRSRNMNFRILIAGSGPDEDALKVQLKNSGLSDYFQFLGFVEPSALNRELYEVADALLLTSSWETGPIVLWEAMAAGLPIVTSRYLGSVSESILSHRSNCLMFDIGDCDTGARHLESLMVDRELVRSIRSRAFSDVSASLTTDISVAQWERSLSKALDVAPISTASGDCSALAQQAGRLDRWFGPSLAEMVRNIRVPTLDSGPGGEWPHTLGGQGISDEDFWRRAERLDRIGDKPGLGLSSGASVL
ncbi:glycosyltransferase family 4 protein [Pseudomonadota bacterium]